MSTLVTILSIVSPLVGLAAALLAFYNHGGRSLKIRVRLREITIESSRDRSAEKPFKRKKRKPKNRIKSRSASSGEQPDHAGGIEIPRWAFGLMAPSDAQRYAWEWGAHLSQLLEEGELRKARRDRRRFIIAAVTLAVALRVRRALGRAR